jgi:hypothetical protein
VGLVPVASSSIRAIGYDGRGGRLEVAFWSGYVYVFWGVSDATYRAFLGSPSKGRFFNHWIRGQYLSVRAA